MGEGGDYGLIDGPNILGDLFRKIPDRLSLERSILGAFFMRDNAREHPTTVEALWG